MSTPLHPCVEALTKLAYGNGEDCRWCRRFIGLDHGINCPIVMLAAALAPTEAEIARAQLIYDIDHMSMEDD